MSCDPKSLAFARFILDATQGAGLTYEQLFEALLLAYSSMAKTYPPGLDIPIGELKRWAHELKEHGDLTRVSAAQANQLQIIFH